MTERKPCYEKMFPDFAHEHLNQRNHGKAFSVLVESAGIGVQRRTLMPKPDEWEDCLHCPDYRTCYDLSMAKLQLWQALQDFD
jgi:hypothetical protein